MLIAVLSACIAKDPARPGVDEIVFTIEIEDRFDQFDEVTGEGVITNTGDGARRLYYNDWIRVLVRLSDGTEVVGATGLVGTPRPYEDVSAGDSERVAFDFAYHEWGDGAGTTYDPATFPTGEHKLRLAWFDDIPPSREATFVTG